MRARLQASTARYPSVVHEVKHCGVRVITCACGIKLRYPAPIATHERTVTCFRCLRRSQAKP